MDLKRIKGLGEENVIITAIEPLGCLPATTTNNSYKKCIEFFNSDEQFHNLLLKQAVKKLNTGTDNNSKSHYIILNIYKSFMSALNLKHFKGNESLGTMLCWFGWILVWKRR
ncbi:hypothetical protein Ddye_029031 [Dipteronia dyeriana]|uniref:Uncharacterized protein n=1 Tax=Dipteronia dyeriana TaxID=168575 RepID=A0AAD9TDP3_9ROSI|nr:hypothetical protein Ddye_029031 [Dipteronia dyeriana]